MQFWAVFLVFSGPSGAVFEPPGASWSKNIKMLCLPEQKLRFFAHGV